MFPYTLLRGLLGAIAILSGIAAAYLLSINNYKASALAVALTLLAPAVNYLIARNRAAKLALQDTYNEITQITSNNEGLCCRVFIYRRISRRLKGWVYYPQCGAAAPVKVCKGVVGKCFRTGNMLRITDVGSDPTNFFVDLGYTKSEYANFSDRDKQSKSFLCAPIVSLNQKVIGVVLASSPTASYFKDPCPSRADALAGKIHAVLAKGA